MSYSTGMEQNMLTRAEVCSILRIGQTTLDRYVREGKINKVKFGSRAQSAVRYRREEVERLAAEGQAPPAPDSEDVPYRPKTW